MSIEMDATNLERLARVLDSPQKIPIKVLEFRNDNKKDDAIDELQMDRLTQIIASGCVSRLVVHDKVWLNRPFMYVVRDNQCEVVFKQVIGNVPNVVWNKGSRGRVVCEGHVGALAVEIAPANVAPRKRVIEKMDSILINARVGDETNVDEVLSKAKINIGSRKIYVVARGSKKRSQTSIRSSLPLQGLILNSEYPTSLCVNMDCDVGVDKLVVYGIARSIFGDAHIKEVILSNKTKHATTKIYGLTIGKITSLFKFKLKRHERMCITLGHDDQGIEVEEVSEFTKVTINTTALVNIKMIKHVEMLQHDKGELHVEKAVGIGSCMGLSNWTYIKEMEHSTAYFDKKSDYTQRISGYRSDEITLLSRGGALNFSIKETVFSPKLVVHGDINNTSFMPETLNIDKIVINGNVGSVNANLDPLIRGRLFVNGIVTRVGGSNPWITNSKHFKRCENKGFVYWQGLGE